MPAATPPGPVRPWSGHRLAGIAEFGPDGLHIVDAAALARLDRDYLSPSTSFEMAGCPARWAGSKLASPPEEAFSATATGTAGHAVLEDLYGMEPDRRTEQAARELLTGRTHPGLADDPAELTRWHAEVWAGIARIFDLEDPTGIDVYKREWAIDSRVGAVPFRGTLDRTQWVEGELTIGDYKTGRVPNPRYPSHHTDQMRLYGLAVEHLTGTLPAAATLYYTRHGVSREATWTRAAMTASADAFARAWQVFRTAVETATFTTATSTLCGWCPLVAACPAAAAEGLGPRAAGLPTAADLALPPGAETPASPPAAPARPGGEPSRAATSREGHHITAEEEDDEMVWMEAEPWNEQQEGKLNHNSYAAMGAWALSRIALEQCHLRGIRPTRRAVGAMRALLASVVLDAQDEITGGNTSFQRGISARLRSALGTVLKVRPMPVGGSGEDWADWQERAVKTLIGLARDAEALWEGEGTDFDPDRAADVLVPEQTDRTTQEA